MNKRYTRGLGCHQRAFRRKCDPLSTTTVTGTWKPNSSYDPAFHEKILAVIVDDKSDTGSPDHPLSGFGVGISTVHVDAVVQHGETER